MGRDMSPNCAVAEMRAGGAVEEPLPSTWTFTFGYERENVSPHSVIRLFIVSEPMLERLPEIPLVFWYGAMAGSTLTAPVAGPLVAPPTVDGEPPDVAVFGS